MINSAWESRTVRANGQRIHLRVAGSGPLVLMCHGFPESWYSWRHQLDALAAAGYRAVAMDMRGYGRSSKPAELAAYRITELVEDCVGVVQALGESKAVIVGHDWGAPVAWTAAWTRPEVFRAVAGLSVPFGGRGLMGLLDDPFGDIRPSLHQREVAGRELLFYQEYYCLSGGVTERDIEADIRGWMAAALYSLSADAPLPPELAGVDLTALPKEMLTEFVHAAMCVPRGESLVWGSLPHTLPAWLTEDDLDLYVAELEYSGFTGGLNYYRNIDLDWELLAGQQGKPLSVPSLFIGGDRDVVTIWAPEAIGRAKEVLTDLRRSVILRNCGHWIQQEQPEAVNRELVQFLKSVS